MWPKKTVQEKINDFERNTIDLFPFRRDRFDGEFIIDSRIYNLLKLSNCYVVDFPAFKDINSKLVSLSQDSIHTIIEYSNGYNIYLYSTTNDGKIRSAIGDSIWTLEL